MTSIDTFLTDHLDTWTSAITRKSSAGRGSSKKFSLYGIEKLRELILNLAVRGKLVPQDPNDEPASELLKRIGREKARLVKVGEIRNPKERISLDDRELAFTVPAGWTVSPLDGLSPRSLTDGDWIETKDQSEDGGVRLIQLADVGVGEFLNKSARYITEEAEVRLNCTRLAVGDVLIARLPNPIGRACIFPDIGQPAITAVDVAILTPDANVSSEFIVLAINAPPVRDQIEAYGKGATRFRVSTGHLKTVQIPLPPLAEQCRIVTKVDELMALCDRLEAGTYEAVEAHKLLVTELLATLSASRDAGELADNWTRIEAHFDTLFVTEDSVDRLKQTILQLAVMGKLVPQDPKDEPALELLRRIKTARANLFASGSLKKSNPLPQIRDADKPFAVPAGWEWARLQDVIDVRDGTHDSPKDAVGKDTYPLITSKDFRDGAIDFSNARQISAEDHREISKRSLVEKGDILFSMIGGNLGNQVMVDDDRPFSVKNVALFKYYDRALTNPSFVKIYTENLAVDLQSRASGGAQPFVALGYLRNLLIAVPPSVEQHRISVKFSEITAICDALKLEIQKGDGHAIQIADAVVTRAVG